MKKKKPNIEEKVKVQLKVESGILTAIINSKLGGGQSNVCLPVKNRQRAYQGGGGFFEIFQKSVF